MRNLKSFIITGSDNNFYIGGDTLYFINGGRVLRIRGYGVEYINEIFKKKTWIKTNCKTPQLILDETGGQLIE